MCQDSELQELRTGRKMKRIAFLPEADTRIVHVQLSSEILHWLYNYVHDRGKSNATNDRERIWSYFFRLGRIRALKTSKAKWKQGLPETVSFAYNIFTDGVAASVHFDVNKPEHRRSTAHVSPDSKKPVLSADSLQPGLYFADDVLKQYEGFDVENMPFVSADPGVITPIQWYDATSDSFPRSIGNREYHHHVNNGFTRDAADQLRDAMGVVKVDMDLAPFKCSTLPDRYEQYVAAVAKHWNYLWFQAINTKYRYGKFERFKRGQRFMDKWLAAGSKLTEGGKIMLFGNGAHKKGGFMSSRGGKAKGPVKKFRKLMAKRCAIISCSEFRSSRCCFHCGRVLLHPKGRRIQREHRPKQQPHFHPKARKIKLEQKASLSQPMRSRPSTEMESYVLNGISYCQEPGHEMFVSRDRDAARKICFLFLYRLEHGAEVDLGAWSRQVKDPETSNALSRSKFLSQFYFSCLTRRKQSQTNEL